MLILDPGVEIEANRSSRTIQLSLYSTEKYKLMVFFGIVPNAAKELSF
jgi:hypothetical protein